MYVIDGIALTWIAVLVGFGTIGKKQAVFGVGVGMPEDRRVRWSLSVFCLCAGLATFWAIEGGQLAIVVWLGLLITVGLMATLLTPLWRPFLPVTAVAVMALVPLTRLFP